MPRKESDAVENTDMISKMADMRVSNAIIISDKVRQKNKNQIKRILMDDNDVIFSKKKVRTKRYDGLPWTQRKIRGGIREESIEEMSFDLESQSVTRGVEQIELATQQRETVQEESVVA